MTPVFVLLLVSSFGAWAQECSPSSSPSVGASGSGQMMVCSGANGTTRVMGNLAVSGKVLAKEPSEQDI